LAQGAAKVRFLPLVSAAANGPNLPFEHFQTSSVSFPKAAVHEQRSNLIVEGQLRAGLSTVSSLQTRKTRLLPPGETAAPDQNHFRPTCDK